MSNAAHVRVAHSEFLSRSRVDDMYARRTYDEKYILMPPTIGSVFNSPYIGRYLGVVRNGRRYETSEIKQKDFRRLRVVGY